MTSYDIALIPGDGIGVDVTDATKLILNSVADTHGFALNYTQFPWSCE
jgi:tartrate dehydrogenase/decarboxylase/D-malate dehydrogenase